MTAAGPATRAGNALVRAYRALVRWIGASPAFALTILIGGAVVVAASFAAGAVYDSVAESDGVAGLDRPVLDAAIALRTPALDGIAAVCAYLFGTIGLPVIAVLAIIVLTLVRRSRLPLVLIASAGVGSLLMTIAAKSIVGRTRPPHADAIPPYESSPSFPSGHTLNAVVVVGMIAYVVIRYLSRRWLRVAVAVAAAVIALGVGLTRILLGAHWFTDVLASWALGAAWLALLIVLHRLHERATGREA